MSSRVIREHQPKTPRLPATHNLQDSSQIYPLAGGEERARLDTTAPSFLRRDGVAEASRKERAAIIRLAPQSGFGRGQPASTSTLIFSGSAGLVSSGSVTFTVRIPLV
jgi:hypothetical protein